MQPRVSVDPLVAEIATYVDSGPEPSEAALGAAWLALFDSIGCAMASTRVPECMMLVGPIVPGTTVEPGVHIPGTSHCVDPVAAAFGTGCLIRWLDFSDTWVALETGHPSDSVGAVLAAAEYASVRRRASGKRTLALECVLRAMIQAYEIHGVVALTNSLGDAGFDHAALVRVASAAAATRLLGGGFDAICSAVSHAWCDGHPLRVYRQAPNTGSRKSWAGPDAAARGVELALRALRGEPACGTVLTDPGWGMEAVLFGGRPLSLSRRLGCYVMENVLFKAAYPGVVHAQTALEAAIRLHPQVAGRLDQIDRIDIWSYAKAIRITSKTGPLNNSADRDHCLQYMTAVGLLNGGLAESDFSDAAAGDPRIDELRGKMVVRQEPRFTAANLDPGIRSSANGVRVTFQDGTSTDRIDVEQPLGHASRAVEGRPHLERKLRRNLASALPPKRVVAVMRIFGNQQSSLGISVEDFISLIVV
jgi:2-methylcitrate dehydratase